jgi:hypothetical protein
MSRPSKEHQLVESIVALADEQLGGERSRRAKWLFYDIANECRDLGYSALERIMRQVGAHYDYD